MIRGLYQKRGFWYFQPPTKNGERPPTVALKTEDESTAIDEVFKLHVADATGP